MLPRLGIPPDQTPNLNSARPIEAVFEESLMLVGIEPATETINVPPGESLRFRLYWQAVAPVKEDFTVFVHLLNNEGQVVAQGDAPPLAGQYPTSVWQPGELLADERQLAIPADLKAGQYRLMAGLYRPADGTRLE
jgi:hypothetical protein